MMCFLILLLLRVVYLYYVLCSFLLCFVSLFVFVCVRRCYPCSGCVYSCVVSSVRGVMCSSRMIGLMIVRLVSLFCVFILSCVFVCVVVRAVSSSCVCFSVVVSCLWFVLLRFRMLVMFLLCSYYVSYYLYCSSCVRRVIFVFDLCVYFPLSYYLSYYVYVSCLSVCSCLSSSGLFLVVISCVSIVLFRRRLVCCVFVLLLVCFVVFLLFVLFVLWFVFVFFVVVVLSSSF